MQVQHFLAKMKKKELVIQWIMDTPVWGESDFCRRRLRAYYFVCLKYSFWSKCLTQLDTRIWAASTTCQSVFFCSERETLRLQFCSQKSCCKGDALSTSAAQVLILESIIFKGFMKWNGRFSVFSHSNQMHCTCPCHSNDDTKYIHNGMAHVMTQAVSEIHWCCYPGTKVALVICTFAGAALGGQLTEGGINGIHNLSARTQYSI